MAARDNAGSHLECDGRGALYACFEAFLGGEDVCVPEIPAACGNLPPQRIAAHHFSGLKKPPLETPRIKGFRSDFLNLVGASSR